jgi:hypothetical protein
MRKTCAMQAQTFRIACPSDDAEALLPIYCEGLGLKVIGSFCNCDGFDGIMLVVPRTNYHFEFTHKCGHVVGWAPLQEYSSVFYLPDANAWQAAVATIRRAGFYPVVSFNPNGDLHRMTFEDSVGYRLVLQNAAWDSSDRTFK